MTLIDRVADLIDWRHADYDEAAAVMDDLRAAIMEREAMATDIDVLRLAYALEAYDPDDDGNLSGSPSDYFMRKARHLRAMYLTVAMPDHDCADGDGKGGMCW